MSKLKNCQKKFIGSHSRHDQHDTVAPTGIFSKNVPAPAMEKAIVFKEFSQSTSRPPISTKERAAQLAKMSFQLKEFFGEKEKHEGTSKDPALIASTPKKEIADCEIYIEKINEDQAEIAQPMGK